MTAKYSQTLIVALLSLLGGALRAASAPEPVVLRVGHFPNITHAQALVARGMARAGNGWFESRLGAGVTIQWFTYNAGPSAMEAILTKSIDLTYVGVSPTLNAHLRTGGKEVRVVAGACSGGAALVVQGDGPIRSDSDFRGKKVATPQLGNTQDVAARAWLISTGLRVTMTGGDALVIPTANPDQLTLFEKKELDAVWTVEPWVTRLVREGKGRVYLEEGSLWKETAGRYTTTHLVSTAELLDRQPGLLKKFLAAHLELTEWITSHPAEAQEIFNREFKEETRKGMSPEVLKEAWKRLEFTVDPIKPSLVRSAEAARKVGFYRQAPDLSRIYQLGILNDVLAEKGKPRIEP
ncbi:MAG TPA: aliphatic sulfonate ABC transporter substrate-binding protein [Verrucomicrobiales bacterium]|nr:aliphatic sulfonate ABC transporter substrate-binding protein [Verrucomicrobiales bacterium]